uniref:Nucleolus and neural progenitor protein-like N-terminal domain-containing protein n=1 Tax=Timema douglasi TaxID=61478 RepID=A0A7R8ZE20_TIMDO|nr:unnamed protein product [Timema douglasi]
MVGLLLWNQRDLPPPPNYTHRTSKQNQDIKQLRNTCNQIVFVLNDLKILHDEGAILSRGLYRIKSKQRNDKSFKLVEKVNQGLKRYLGLNLLGVVSHFVPPDPESSDVEAYLPSRQMLEFVLVRIQSFARLFCHVVRCCEQAALYLKMKLSGGHMWTVSLMFFAQVSRIWAYSRFLTFSSCKWYSSLLVFLQVLPRSPMPWLPPDYELPTDLAQWLDAHWLTETPTAQSGHNRAVNAQKIFDLINLIDEDDSDTELTAFEQLEAIKPEITDEQSLQASVSSLDQSMRIYRDSLTVPSSGVCEQVQKPSRYTSYKLWEREGDNFSRDEQERGGEVVESTGNQPAGAGRGRKCLTVIS